MRVICIPLSLPISPEPRLGEVWSREGDLVAMATSAAFLPRRRRPQEFRANPFPTNFFGLWNSARGSGHPWEAPDVPCGQTGPGDGQQIHKNPVSPILDWALGAETTSVLLKGTVWDTGEDSVGTLERTVWDTLGKDAGHSLDPLLPRGWWIRGSLS